MEGKLCYYCGMQEKEEFTLVPREKLSEQALLGLIEEFILREGTDYGHAEVTLEGKRKGVFRQLDAGAIQIVYSHLTENCTLLRREDVGKY